MVRQIAYVHERWCEDQSTISKCSTRSSPQISPSLLPIANLGCKALSRPIQVRTHNLDIKKISTLVPKYSIYTTNPELGPSVPKSDDIVDRFSPSVDR